MKKAISLFADLLSPARRRLQQARSKWGKQAVKEGGSESHLFDLTRDSITSALDDKTWIDLELPQVFVALNSTETGIGSQYLYRQLRTVGQSSQEILQHQSLRKALRENVALRERVQRELSGLRDERIEHLVDAVFGSGLSVSGAIRFLPWWSLACAAMITSAIALNLSPWIIVAVATVNLLAIVKFALPLHRTLEVLRACYRMLCVAEALAGISSEQELPREISELRSHTPERRQALSKLRLVSSLQSGVNAYITVWLNLAVLAELAVCVRTVGAFNEFRKELAAAFGLLGKLDAAIAVASFLHGQRDCCEPAFTNAKKLAFTEVRHPLIANPVSNSISLDDQCALVTGSNMAGKTTFIKTVGINVVLARALGFCLAKNATIPTMNIMASIRTDHSVASGKSKFFVELEAIRSFVEAADSGQCGLFLLDEPFSGTNTVERLALGRAVLESLSAHAIVLATTHDVELQADLSAHYDLFHFQEDPDVDGYFDYRLRLGHSAKRNAIRLLEREGFPEKLILMALSYAQAYAR